MQRFFEGVFFNIFLDLISESALDWVTNDSQVVLESIYEGVELMIESLIKQITLLCQIKQVGLQVSEVS
jgi:hypothetical protein